MQRSGAAERIVMRAGLVLELYDDFTDQPVRSEQIRVHSPQNVSVIKKPGGYFVCLNPPSAAFDLCIESPYFYPLTLHIPDGEGERALGVRRVRMIPNPCYPLPEGALRLTGRAQPDSVVYMVHMVPEKAFQLLYDYKREE